MKHKKNEFGLYVVQIEDQKYEFEKWGAEDALETLLEIGVLVGKPLGMAVASAMDEGGIDKKLDPNMIGLIMDALTTRFNVKEVKAMIIRLASKGVMLDGKQIVFNKHYEDRLELAFQVAYAALEVQYGNFMNAVLGLLGAKAPRVKNKS